ncbi:MAG: protein kinase domain-containing protein [Bryobacteraceae bacterium]
MKSIGKYQVIEELGGSPVGKTYRVRDAFRHREFAAKVLETVPDLTAEAKEQFCGYLASCAELTHRHIAKVHDLGEVDQGIFVVTEWRSGTDLRRFIESNHDLPLDQKLGVMAQVAEGLAFAHSRGIAHGNLKPSNIFVDAERDVAILDFGIAKWLGALLEAGCRREGLVANYLAPEQVLGQPFDARSDIFALGLMLYEFASGKYPFSAAAGLIPREIVHGEPEPLSQLNAQIPEDLEQLVARALKKTPEQRLQTAEEFASGLYLAAQQFRHAAASAAPSAAPAIEAQSNDEEVNQLPPALTSQPMPLEPAAPSVPEAAERLPAEQPVVRERPQDAEPQARPWTARSYAAGKPIAPITAAGAQTAPIPKETPPGRPAATPAYRPPTPPESPAFLPPQSFIKPVTLPPPPVPSKSGKLSKGVLTAVIGLILAVAMVGSFISRQNLKASQNKSHVVAPPSEPAAPVAKPSAPRPEPAATQVRVPKPEETTPEEAVNPEVSAPQILNGPVRTLWESGRYAQALALVNQVLASDSTNENARSWKKKIREAQAAEAALK